MSIDRPKPKARTGARSRRFASRRGRQLGWWTRPKGESDERHDADPQATGRTTHYINGRWTETGGRTFADHNPFDGALYAEIAAGGRSEAQAAVDAAAAAFPAWAEATPRQRQTLFLKAADIVERRAKEFTTTMALETGAGAAFSGFLIRWSIDMLRQAAGWGYLPVGDVLASDVPAASPWR